MTDQLIRHEIRRPNPHLYQDQIQKPRRDVFWSLFVGAAGVMGLWLVLFKWQQDTGWMIALFIISFACAVAGLVTSFLTILKWWRMDENGNNGRDIREFAHDVEMPPVRIQSVDGLTILRSKVELSNRQWRQLAHALARHDWIWTRDGALKDAGVFTSLNTRYSEITADFERMGIIRSRGGRWVVTERGKEMLTNAGET